MRRTIRIRHLLQQVRAPGLFLLRVQLATRPRIEDDPVRTERTIPDGVITIFLAQVQEFGSKSARNAIAAKNITQRSN
ncbi:hypothetical protein ASG47_09535 [Devosia sp. Leaf420]|nr:hypothetical protein ASG47_09535 [Devosia sp. Leaf420]